MSFDEYAGESQVQTTSREEVERVLIGKGLAEIYEGALAVNFENHGTEHLSIATLHNRNGTTSCLLRGIGAAIELSKKYNFDRMIYVVMSEKNAHLR